LGIVAFNIIERNFYAKNTSLYNLSVLIGADRFSYAITSNDNQLLALKSFTFETDKNQGSFQKEIQDIFIEDTTLSRPYNKIRVGLSNQVTTLVPDQLFDADKTNVYLEAQTDQLIRKTIQTNPIASLGAKNIYAYDKEALMLVKGYLPNAQFFHASSALIEGALRSGPNEGSSKIYLNIHSNIVQIVLMNGSKLIFSNNFSFLSEKDLLYYVMLVFDQFKLSPKEVTISLSGHVIKDSEIYKSLYKYIQTLEFNNTSPSISFGENFQGTPPHFFFDLFSLSLCES